MYFPKEMARRRVFSPLWPSRWEYVGYAEINKGFKGIMNLRVLAASAQAPQRSNGSDFPPHNAPRPGTGGLGRGRLLKEDGGAVVHQGLCVQRLHPFPVCPSSIRFLLYYVVITQTCAPHITLWLNRSNIHSSVCYLNTFLSKLFFIY